MFEVISYVQLIKIKNQFDHFNLDEEMEHEKNSTYFN